MNDRRDSFGDLLIFLVCYIAYAALVLSFVIVCVAGEVLDSSGDAAEFAPKPKDRPVLETPQQVWEARTTGTCTFYFDGTRYVVTNLPKHYVDYSSWYVRMP